MQVHFRSVQESVRAEVKVSSLFPKLLSRVSWAGMHLHRHCRRPYVFILMDDYKLYKQRILILRLWVCHCEDLRFIECRLIQLELAEAGHSNRLCGNFSDPLSGGRLWSVCSAKNNMATFVPELLNREEWNMALNQDSEGKNIDLANSKMDWMSFRMTEGWEKQRRNERMKNRNGSVFEEDWEKSALTQAGEERTKDAS